MRDIKHVLKRPQFYDLLWVGGATLVILTIFIFASYHIQSFYYERSYSTYIYTLKNSIDKKLENQFSILRTLESRISSVSYSQYEEIIPIILKDDYRFIVQNTLDHSNIILDKYFLTSNHNQLISSQGKISHPQIVLKGINIKDLNLLKGKYFFTYTTDELFLGLRLKSDEYIFIKSLKASLLGDKEARNAELISPNPKLGSLFRIHPVPYRNNSI